MTGARPVRPFPEYLAWLADNRATGMVEHGRPGRRRIVMLADGEIRAARSELPDERLGAWLVARGLLAPEERDEALAGPDGEGAPPIGHILVRKGLVSEPELERELHLLAITIIQRAAADPHAPFAFREGENDGLPDTLLGVTTRQLLLAAARSFGDLQAMRRAIGPFDQVAWPLSDLESVSMELELTPAEAFVLSRLEGSPRLADLESVCPLPRDEFVRGVYALKVVNLLATGEPPAERPLPMPSLEARRAATPPSLTVDEGALSEAEREERHAILRAAQAVTRLDHYEALGIRPDASLDEIRRAWRRAQERYSPERATQPHLADLRRELLTVLERAEEAYLVLSDPVSRDRYDRVREAVRRGRSALESEDDDRRREDAAKVRAEIVRANLEAAEAAQRTGEIFLAVQLLEQVCQFEPTAERLWRLARLLLRNPLWAKRCLEALRKAIELDPDFADAWVDLAEFWRRRGNAERQRKALERALAAQPDHDRATRMYQQLRGRKELERLLRRVRQR